MLYNFIEPIQLKYIKFNILNCNNKLKQFNKKEWMIMMPTKERTTIRDVAALAGVSVGTVSMVLNGSNKLNPETRQRVMDAVIKLDYRRNPHARSLSTQKSMTIGLIITDLTNPFFGMMVGRVQQEIDSRGYDLLLGMTKNDIEREKKVIAKFIDSAVDGIIIVPAHYRNPNLSHIYALEQRNIPYVYLTTYYPGTRGSCAMTDLAQGSYELTNYLLETGHKNIVMISGYVELVLSAERLRGFRRAHEEHGLEVRADQIVEAEPDYNGGREAFDQIIKRGKPDAIMTVNDIVSMGVLTRAREVGLRVPEDLSVAGYDDLLYSSMLETSLTTVRQPIKEMSAAAVDMIFKAAEGETVDNKLVMFKPQLFIRSSTKNRL